MLAASVDPVTGVCSVQLRKNVTATSAGLPAEQAGSDGNVTVPGLFAGWEILACVAADGTKTQRVVMQHIFRRWSVLVAVSGTSGAAVISLRSSVGAAAEIVMPRYNFTAVEPDYFLRAVHERGDYVSTRINQSSARMLAKQAPECLLFEIFLVILDRPSDA